MVFEGHVPDHHLVDHALKIGAAGAINAQLVEVDVGKRAAGVGVFPDQDAVHVLAKVAVVKHGDQVGPALGHHVAEGFGLVVVKTPLLI